MKRKLGKCLCSMLLALAMVIGLLPGMGMTVYAAMDQNKTFKAGDMIHSGFPMEWIRFGDENNTRKQVDDCTIQSITYNETSGKWVVSIPTVPWEDPLSLSYPSQTGKVFVGLKWASTSGNPVTNGYYQLAAVYEDAPTVTVTYSVVNGTWSDGTTADKTETVQSGSAPASVPSGMIAGSGFTGGSWDTDPASATITGDTTFTYTFAAKTPISYTVTFNVANGSWNEGGSDAQTVTLTGYEGDTLTLSASQIPAVGSNPDATYKAGSWDTTPTAGMEITADTTFTYTFEAESVDPDPDTPTPDPDPVTPTPEPVTPAPEPEVPADTTPSGSSSPAPVITPEQAREMTIRHFVERIYLIALNRSYDVTGRDYWVDQITNKDVSGSAIARGFFNSQEFIARELDNEEFVNILYRVFFDREPDTQGFANWINALENGATRSEVINGFTGSTEWTSMCARFGINA